jgi:CHAT domain-containing protein
MPQYSRKLSTRWRAAEIIAGSENHHSTLIEYALGTEHSYVWVIDGGKIETHILPARERIEFAVKKWLALATARIVRPGETSKDHFKRVEAADRDLPGLAGTLSCMLLGPFLRPGMQQLAIVPDGELQLLPFAALPENGCKSAGEPLAVERQIVLAPSLSVLLAQYKVTSPESFLGDVALFADPVFDTEDPRVSRTDHGSPDTAALQIAPVLPRLTGTRDEAKAIAALAGSEHADLYLDFDASLKSLLSTSLRGYRILHLASHGIFDESMPGFSGIVLSLVGHDGQPVFGYLKTHDILGLDLHSDLVVLSACDSAAGINLSGEGVAGLNHAFLSAGAKRVVSTLWGVDDETSKELMISFYTGLLRDGLDPPEALRRSQIQIMRNSRTRAPYYWAAFNITSAIQ